MYNETIGIITFAASFIGFNILYFPYFFMIDMPRRVDTFTITSGLASLNLTATIGAYIFGPAFLLAILNLVFSLRKAPSEANANPWNAKEMEWTGNYLATDQEASTEDPEKLPGTIDNTKISEGDPKMTEEYEGSKGKSSFMPIIISVGIAILLLRTGNLHSIIRSRSHNSSRSSSESFQRWI